MKPKMIKGKITTLGPYVNRQGGSELYDYFKVTDTMGTEYLVPKVLVTGVVANAVTAGVEGVFIFLKTFVANELVAIHTESHSEVSPSVTHKYINYIPGVSSILLGLLLISFSFFLGSIFFLLGGWGIYNAFTSLQKLEAMLVAEHIVVKKLNIF